PFGYLFGLAQPLLDKLHVSARRLASAFRFLLKLVQHITCRRENPQPLQAPLLLQTRSALWCRDACHRAARYKSHSRLDAGQDQETSSNPFGSTPPKQPASAAALLSLR